MRVAHIVSTFAPQIGGMGSVCADEAMSLAKRGHEVTVFTLAYPGVGDYKEHDAQFPFKVVRLKALVKMGDAGLVPQILGKLKNNFDLVHLHYPFYGGAEWLVFSEIPTVVTYHMDAQARGLKLVFQKVYDLIWPKLIFTKARKIVLVDPSFRGSKLLQNITKDKIVEINNGVNLDIFKPQLVDLVKLDLVGLQDKKIILFVGNILPLKRLDLLIRSLKLLDDKDLVLLVVGGGYDSQNCQKLAKDLGVDKQVIFVGPCQDKLKLAQYYNIASCVAVPSDYESFSLVAIEAMACGKPLAVSDLAVFKNKVEGAVFFERGSVESLAEALKKVLSLSIAEKKIIGDLQIEKVKKEFSWQDHIEKLINVYSKIVNQ